MTHLTVSAAAAVFFLSAAASAAPDMALSPVSPAPDAPASAPMSLMDGAASPQEPRESSRRTGAVFVLRGGFYSGKGGADLECEGVDCSSLSGTSHDEPTSFVLGTDLLVNLSRGFRLGLGLELFPKLQYEDGGAARDLGAAGTAGVVLEGVVDLSAKTALTLRGATGFGLLAPFGDLATTASEARSECREIEGPCRVDLGPYPMATAAFGPGLRFELAGAALRFDLQLQAWAARTVKVNMDAASVALVYSGTRSTLAVGVEL
ncbi:MAG: hypothetical protein KF718_23450 [Polyangiaceae bacterium]|nr:hypothetical protein [Polyangiaceae bacterium]